MANNNQQLHLKLIVQQLVAMLLTIEQLTIKDQQISLLLNGEE